MNSTLKKGVDRYLWSRVETFTRCCGDNYFPTGKFQFLIGSFTRCTLFFQYLYFLLLICLPCVSRGTHCNKNKCCVVTHRAADIQVAWLVFLVCLPSHVLRAYCNFESNQVIPITLFGRRPKNNMNCSGTHNI